MDWDFKNGLPIYSQIVDIITMQIASRQYAPGQKLPSVRDLAMDAGVNPNTMQRALSELERRGLVYTERTNGRFVTQEESMLQELRHDLARDYIREFVEKLRSIGMTDAEIASAVHTWLKEV